MEIFIAIVAVLCGITGIIGSIAPALPGPPISWVGMLLLYFWGGTDGAGETMSLTILLVWLGIVIVVSILDYVVPAYFTKVTGGSKYASIGATVGLVAGLFIPPVGMITDLRRQKHRHCAQVRTGSLHRIPCRNRYETDRLRSNDVLYNSVYLI